MWEDDPIQIQSQCLPIPGRDVESAGVTPFSDLTIDDQYVFDNYKHVISERIRQEPDLRFPENFEFVPTSVARQIESPNNCYFRIDLPHSIVTIKIIPNPRVHDLSKHITLRREPFVYRKCSNAEPIL
ncbi:unnamed protein product [Rotaria sordida]|uniref:Uncharacterized protein n=1 Tax=Rotaria sordida TaxID=392033 RepID=A0A814VET3_9BILA|nr:unnamed protein product [Rotaria sordida]CAF1186046.1 unnamed protein product [Rotaria sordida]CAF3640498.1 unnamed protein product [Rotaria sordida]CAF3838751.1 unnamed protein product [Rotaria sordida]